MPVDSFTASGWTPRGQNEEQSRRAMIQWLQTLAQSGQLMRRSPMAPSPWHWSVEQNPQQTMIGLPAGSSRQLEIEQRLWNFLEIPAGMSRRSRQGFTTTGYVTCRLVNEQRGGAGDIGVPGAGGQREFRYFDAVRCLPETDREALLWGYDTTNARAWMVILRECQRYNTTIRNRLVAGYSAGRAHTSAVHDMQHQSHHLILRAAFEIALSAGSSGGMNFAPFLGDYASQQGVSMMDLMPVR